MDECFTIFRDGRVYCKIEFDISKHLERIVSSSRIPINVKKSKKKKKSPPLASTKYRQVLIWNARSRRDSGAFNQLAARISLPSSSPPSPGAKIWTNGGRAYQRKGPTGAERERRRPLNIVFAQRIQLSGHV